MARTRYQPMMTRFVSPYYFPSHAKTNYRATTEHPAVNIVRKESAYTIDLALPGLTKEQIRIDVADNQLTVSAQQTPAPDQAKFVRKEFDYTNFKRTFRLHQNANTEAMTASFENGILTITIPDLKPEVKSIEIV
jgi:HSP20 family protein